MIIPRKKDVVSVGLVVFEDFKDEFLISGSIFQAKIDTRFLQARNEYSAFEALQLTSALSLGEDLASNRPSEDLNSSFCYSCLRLSEEMGGEEFARFCLFSR